MKKTLAAVAVLGAFAGSAMAADVTLYGVVDEALVYTHSKVTGSDATDKLELASGKQAGSRFGLKGVEDLGDGFKVGFILENGFSADDGSLTKYGQKQTQSRIFGREAVLYVDSDFGRLTVGRAGQLNSGNGSVGITGGMSPFGTSSYGFSNASSVMVGFDRIDNSVTYSSPAFAGFKVYAQASLKNNSEGKDNGKDANDAAISGTEGDHTSDRYYAIGATYTNAGLALTFVADMYDWGSKDAKYNHNDYDDGYSITLGGSYDFEVVKAYLGAQYYDDMIALKKSYGISGDIADGYKSQGMTQFKGWGVTAGVDVPCFGGTFKFGAAYGGAEDVDNSSLKFKRYSVDAGYVYPFSKRTNVYATVGYQETKAENLTEDFKTKKTQAMVGLRHQF